LSVGPENPSPLEQRPEPERCACRCSFGGEVQVALAPVAVVLAGWPACALARYRGARCRWPCRRHSGEKESAAEEDCEQETRLAGREQAERQAHTKQRAIGSFFSSAATAKFPIHSQSSQRSTCASRHVSVEAVR
jgi:hypothetical protein